VKTVRHAADRDALLARIAALSPGTPRQWGTMSAGAMLAHLCASAEMALGDLQARPRGPRLFHHFPIKHLALYLLPIPRGAPTAPELVMPEAPDFEADRARLVLLVTRLGATPSAGMGPAHPLFGLLTWREWGALAHKHMDHHLRQFGV
jgi:hypothetical protein